MSLLLDALRRAEQDSKKRKLADAETPAAAPDLAQSDSAAAAEQAAPLAELTLEAQTDVALEPVPKAEPAPVPQPAAQAQEAVQLDMAATPGPAGLRPASDASFLDFELPAEDTPLPEVVVPASLAPRKASSPYGRYDRPAWEDSSSNWGALVANPVSSKRPASGAAASGPGPLRPAARGMTDKPSEGHSRPAGTAVARPAEKQSVPTPPLAPVTTPRQALSAAGVMAGKKTGKATDLRPQRRRQWVLGIIALLLALPIMAFLLFGDAMFGSSSNLVAVNTPALSAPPASPAEPEPAAPVVAPAAALPEAVPVSPPEAAPASPVVQSVPPSRTPAADAPTRVVVNKPARSPASRSRPARIQGPVAASVASSPPPSSTARPGSLMDSAYAAYQSGNTVEAARLYREVLKADATQRDAWLGLAVIAHSNNQLEPAMDAYRRVLRLEPQNATALAGVSNLSRAAGEPQQESRLRELLARSPQEADLNHALALVLSGEQRWSEAQPLFFKAHALAPKEPQFAYNLAVALDHMRKSSLAAQYYETALGLAQGKAAGFDELNARTRLAALRAAR
ncbi:tetratricopeptide repeat protein [Polaromonas sp.]|uniref:tetratricopeptide repeat protein n=1 Tax=Polaromonas sp. TaxID=1869339 RepID=UPI0032638FFE